MKYSIVITVLLVIETFFWFQLSLIKMHLCAIDKPNYIQSATLSPSNYLKTIGVISEPDFFCSWFTNLKFEPRPIEGILKCV